MKPVLVVVLTCAAIAACGGGSGSGECGDGARDPDEQCDDGNVTDGDGCSAACMIEIPAGCGDGVVAGTEQCDTAGESATCDVDCTLAECGDAIHNVAAGEACDDGNVDNGDGCSSDCHVEIPGFCGDGNVGVDEQCDDGGETATCDLDCTPAACGDGTVNPTAGEQCDDANTAPGDGCSATCQAEACGAAPLDCGEHYLGNTGDANATMAIDTYTCLAGDKSGPEVVFDWIPAASGHDSVYLEGNANLDVIVVEALPGCGVGTCVGAGHAGVTVDVVGGTHYLIIVDTNAGAPTAPYQVGIFCE